MPNPQISGYWDIDGKGGTKWVNVPIDVNAGASMLPLDSWPDFAFEDYDPELHLPQDWRYDNLSTL